MPENASPALREYLLRRYDDLKRRLTRHLGSADMASDALHEAWIRLESREDLVGVQNLSAYVMRMAINIALDHLDRNKRLMGAEQIDETLALPDPTPGPMQTIEARAELESLVEVIQKMPLRRRQVLLLVRLEGLTHRQVAERLGISERTVSNELRVAHEFCSARTGRS